MNGDERNWAEEAMAIAERATSKNVAILILMRNVGDTDMAVTNIKEANLADAIVKYFGEQQ